MGSPVSSVQLLGYIIALVGIQAYGPWAVGRLFLTLGLRSSQQVTGEI